MAPFTVSVLHCSPESDDQYVQDRLTQAIDEVIDLKQALSSKHKVFIKPNLGTEAFERHRGRYQSITDLSVLKATVAAIRRFYGGDIVVGEAPTVPDKSCQEVFAQAGYVEALRDYEVRLLDLDLPPFAEYSVPGGGLMFSSYTLSKELTDADFVISLAKMKSHLSTGATLTLKNLFGIAPLSIYGRPRRYLHAPVRLPRTLVDLGLIFKPDLCLIDGLVAQDHREWGGPPVDRELLIAGNNTVATDAVASRLMGFDPAADYGQPPYVWDRNPLTLAQEAGLGSVRVEDIEVKGDRLDRLSALQFDVDRSPAEMIDEIRISLASQAEVYLARRDELLSQFRNKIIGLVDGKVVLVADSVNDIGSRSELMARVGAANRGLFLKRVVPAEEEIEHLEVYQGELAPMRSALSPGDSG